jgi:hypothetical protein
MGRAGLPVRGVAAAFGDEFTVDVEAHLLDSGACADEMVPVLGQSFSRNDGDDFVVAVEDVVEGDGHLQALLTVMEVAASIWGFVVVILLHAHLAGFRVEAVEPQTAIEET